MPLFKKKNQDHRPVSLSELTWKRFKKEKQGIIALAYILIIMIVAILGYLITPDQTPYCNHQQLEIALKKPGFKVLLLNIKNQQVIEKRNVFKKMLFGQPAFYRTIPIENYEIAGDSVRVTFFEQEGEYGIGSFALSELRPDEPVSSKRFLLGTDRYGRDVLSQLMMGSRISLAVGFISIFIALIIGVLVGAVAGFYRGKIDDILMFIINVVWSIPTLLLVIAISFALGKGFWQIFIAIGLTMWVDIARVVRGQVISLREQEYVEAGRALGFSNLHIIFKHILPNILGSVIVISASNFSSAILMEAGLSFLGLGVQPPTPSWGMMMKENYAYIVLDNAYLAIVPGIAIMLLVLAFMLIGNALRNAMDIKN
ncbi:ABC transporter permease [Bacteroidales bacterium OttesenSCG-928-L19]|nr:ABC transporter permease [Bacteroidales bacterium OttesenSCG-928-L19]